MAATKKTIDTRQLILDSLDSLIKRREVENITLKDIANEAHLSKGTLYYYYTQREQIFADLLDDYLASLMRDYLTWIEDSHKDTSLPRAINYILERGARGTDRQFMHIFMLNLATCKSDELRNKFKEKYISWRKLFQKTLESKLPNKEYAETFALVLLTIIDGIIIQEAIGVDNIDTKKITNLLLKGNN
ncbi:MAG: TetR/AcrR family transcriptional regulator [Clostridia bacterium]